MRVVGEQGLAGNRPEREAKVPVLAPAYGSGPPTA